jgi:predicted nuclease of predicted toxin-antitoxin system
VLFLVDTNLPRRLAVWLIARGHQCEHVLDLGMGQSADSELWSRCADNGAIILTKDEDFANWVLAGRRGPAVVWLRTGNGTTDRLIESLAPVFEDVEAHLEAGDRLIEIR